MIESRNLSQNATTESPIASVLGVQGYIALNSVLIVLLVFPQLFLSILTIAGLCAEKTFKKIKAQRNLLICIAAMGFVSTNAEVLLAIAEYLFVNGQKEAGVVFCHGSGLSYYIVTTMRFSLLASLSVTVYITVKHGLQKIRSTYLYIALVIATVVVLLLGFPYVMPFAISYNDPLDGVVCSGNPSVAGYIGIGLAIVVVGIPTRTVAIGTVIATLVFAKKHHTEFTEFKDLKMAMVKLISCLIILNIVVTIANNTVFIPFIIFATTKDHVAIDFPSFVVVTELGYYISQSISSIGTPLVMMAVFKPLCKGIKKVLVKLYTCCKDWN